jgi:outer membrane PBP1 activator LpoA protein
MLKCIMTGLSLLLLLLPNLSFADSPNQEIQAAQSYLEQSKNSAFPQNIEFRLQAADVYIQSGFTVQAKELLESVPVNSLPSHLRVLHRLLLAEWAIKNQQPSKALEQTYLLQNQQQEDGFSPAYRLRMHLIRAKAYEALSQPIESIKERQIIETETDNPAILLKNRQDTWKTLTQLPTEQLKRLSAKNNSENALGWITLAIIHKQYDATPDKFIQAIEGWKRQYPSHPAHDVLPNYLNKTASLKNGVKQVSLLLPLEGDKAILGQAIKEGFLSGYKYADPKYRPEVKIYDTSVYHDMTALYQKAVEEGADFIVGPLFKEEVKQLSMQPDGFFSVPLLALNQANESQTASLPSRFFQFALSPEQEAELLAEKIIQLNKHYPILVVPNNDWGKRFAHSFDQKLGHLKGASIEIIYIQPQQNINQTIRQKFEINSSQERFRQVSRMLGVKIEVQPRRRQDLDSLVLAISPQQARQIKPLLDFYYAHDLPVFGSSNIYSGSPNPNKDMDLNGIQFCDMPWFIAPTQTNYAQRGGQVQTLPEQQARLFAMGVDAFDLSLQLKRLSTSPTTSSYAGMTGKLSIGENNIINRQLVWAEFKNGVPVRMKLNN